MNIDFKPQVPKEHYFKDYDTKERWMSYWHQINEVLKTNPETVLEIGIGNEIVTNYLKNQGIMVITADIDKSLKPDYVCSVTELSNYFKENSFDTILCAEVLEHIPFEYFEKSLREMQKVARNYVIMSLPHFGIKLRLSLKIPLIKEKNILIKLPYRKEHKFDGGHYWEIGKRGHSLNRILSVISKFFEVEKNYLVPENLYHMFFILRIIK